MPPRGRGRGRGAAAEGSQRRRRGIAATNGVAAGRGPRGRASSRAPRSGHGRDADRGPVGRSVFVMSADNGGPSGSDADDANNYPLRGGKYSDFEGGVRVSSVVAGGRVPASMRGAVLAGVDSYVHLVDWYATFCALAGLDAADDDAVDQTGARLPGTDGFDVWPLVSGRAVPKTTSRRTTPRYYVSRGRKRPVAPRERRRRVGSRARKTRFCKDCVDATGRRDGCP